VRPRRRFWRDRSGAAAVEFALVTPLLLALIVGIAELAHWGWGAAATRALAAAAARCIAVEPQRCGTADATRAAMAQSSPAISRNTRLDFEKAACGIRVTAHGGYPARLTPGLGATTAVACG
jgi:Flp pilus assembly protein TadG